MASGTIESMGLYILMAVPRERRLAYSFTNFYAHRVEVTYSYNHKAGIEQHQYWLKEQEAYLDRAFTEEEQIMRIVESGTKLDWDAVKRLYNQPQHFGTGKAIEWGFISGLFE